MELEPERTEREEVDPETAAIIDLDGVLERMDGDRELLIELAQMFLESAPEMLAQMRQACAAGDAERLHHTAHSLKGSAGNLGGVAVYETARRLETLGRECDLGPAVELLAALEADLARFATALRALV